MFSGREVFSPRAVVAGAGRAATVKSAGPEIYTPIGVRPFINCTATYTINRSWLMLPEGIATIEHASHYHVSMDGLMEKIGDRLGNGLRPKSGVSRNPPRF